MAFNINDFLNEESKKDIKSDWKPVRVSARKLRPAPDKTNFYHAEDKEIKDLAESIELIGLQQYPVIRPVEGTDEYEVIAGHKRRLAVLRLLDEGKAEYEMIPCKVETPDDIRNELILIFTNLTQRERTDYEKMREIERVRELLTEYQKTNELTGRKQNIIAEILGTNKTKVGTLDNINNNLIAPFKEEFAAGTLSTSAANEIAGLGEGAQQALYETYKETGSLTAKDAKAVKEQQDPQKEAGAMTPVAEGKSRRPTDSEIQWLYYKVIREYDDDRNTLADRLKEKCGKSWQGGADIKNSYRFNPKGVRINDSDCISYPGLVKRLNLIFPRRKKVSESDTFGKTQDEPAQEICFTSDESDIDDVIEFIFFMDDFPEDKLDEIIRGMGSVNRISQQLVFDRMLPYENTCVRVIYRMGYQVEYIHTGKTVRIPIHDFWKGFERVYKQNYREEEPELPAEAELVEKVSESDTFGESPAAVGNAGEDKGIKFRGGYKPVLVDKLIGECEGFLEVAILGKLKDRISKYSCLLDALALLRDRMAQEGRI